MNESDNISLTENEITIAIVEAYIEYLYFLSVVELLKSEWKWENQIRKGMNKDDDDLSTEDDNDNDNSSDDGYFST